MAKVGIVYAVGSKMIRSVVYSDERVIDDHYMTNVHKLRPGEAHIIVEHSELEHDLTCGMPNIPKLDSLHNAVFKATGEMCWKSYRCAVIENKTGKVVHIAPLDPAIDRPPRGHTLREIPNDVPVDIGWTWEGN